MINKSIRKNYSKYFIKTPFIPEKLFGSWYFLNLSVFISDETGFIIFWNPTSQKIIKGLDDFLKEERRLKRNGKS